MGLELNIYMLKEIMNLDVEIEEGYSTLNSFALLKKYVDVQVINDEQNNLFYKANIDEILNSPIELSELMILRHSGWEISNDDKFLLKHLA